MHKGILLGFLLLWGCKGQEPIVEPPGCPVGQYSNFLDYGRNGELLGQFRFCTPPFYMDEETGNITHRWPQDDSLAGK